MNMQFFLSLLFWFWAVGAFYTAFAVLSYMHGKNATEKEILGFMLGKHTALTNMLGNLFALAAASVFWPIAVLARGYQVMRARK